MNPIGPRAVYDEAKRYAEALTAAYRRTRRMDTAIVRIFNVYGPHMRREDGRAVPTLIEQALRDEPLTVTGDGCQTRSLCYIDDLIEGIVRLLRSDHPGPVNIGNPHEITISALAATILELTGSPSRVEYIPRPPDDPARRCPDIALARQCLGWNPSVPLAEGLNRTIAWFRDRSTLTPVAGQQRSSSGHHLERTGTASAASSKPAAVRSRQYRATCRRTWSRISGSSTLTRARLSAVARLVMSPHG